MTKFALLIGCGYNNTPNSLGDGCFNDIKNVYDLLTNHYGYLPQNIVKLQDNFSDPTRLPTRANILAQLNSLVAKSSNSEIWFHYSGHGSTEALMGINDNESVIIPCDAIRSNGTFNLNNLIDADKIHTYMPKISTSCLSALFFFDSCNSGTLCELPYTYNYTGGSFNLQNSTSNTLPCSNIYMISGCKNTEESASIYLANTTKLVGAFTSDMILTLQQYNYTIDIVTLYKNTIGKLSGNSPNQHPILSSSNKSPELCKLIPSNNQPATVKKKNKQAKPAKQAKQSKYKFVIGLHKNLTMGHLGMAPPICRGSECKRRSSSNSRETTNESFVRICKTCNPGNDFATTWQIFPM